MLKTSFNKDWVFHVGSGSALGSLLGGDSAENKPVTLPHDAEVGMKRDPKDPGGSGNGFFKTESYNYTKEFMVDAADKEKNIWIEFEGIYENAAVYINNSFAGKCPYGYSNFYIDATRLVKFGEKNFIKVIIKNAVPSGRWYTGGGIYRDVNLCVADRLHLVPDGIHLAAVDIEDGQAVVRAESTIEYNGIGVRDLWLCVQLLDQDGNTVAQNRMPITAEEQMKKTYRQMLYVENPVLWDVESPNLYQYRAFIEENEKVIDEEVGTFGIRKLQLDVVHGLRINGNEVKLRGGCIHHDNGVIGTAEFAHAEEFRVKRMKEAGYNAIRSSHYPMSRKLLDACDKYGMLVMDEFSDVWTTTKVDFDYGLHMTEWWEHDLTNLVNKDYNHPCVIMYSIGNEIPETGNKFDVQWGKKFADYLRALDDTRYTTNSLNLMLSIMDQLGDLMAMAGNAAGDGSQTDANLNGEMEQQEQADAAGQKAISEQPAEINSMMSSLTDVMNKIIAENPAVGTSTQEAFAQVDIAGYNYAACRYELDHVTYPNRIMVGSETYPKDLDVNWELVEKHPYLIGDFSWTAWDYLGEAGIGKIHYEGATGFSFYAPFPCKAAYCGDMNLCGDRRPVSYWREIIWGLRKAPYIGVQPPKYHDVTPHMSDWSMTDAVHSWNWEGQEGNPVTVEVYTDGDEAALYVNDALVEKKSVGEKKKAIAYFETIYTPGTIKVVAYKDGQEAGTDEICTAKAEVHPEMMADAAEIPADESDICYVEIFMVDADGVLNTDAKDPVTVSVEGPGVILGYGSADPDSDEEYFDLTAKPFEGRLRAAIRGNGGKGTITVKADAGDGNVACVTVEAV